MSTSFKIVTWNVENLFRPARTAKRAEREAYAEKLVFLAETLRRLKPDVIALQEVGGDTALADLQTALGKRAFPHRRVGAEDGRGIAVAFLSRLAFRAEEDVKEFPAPVLALRVSDLSGSPLRTMGRGAVRVRVKKGSFTTDLINVHLKSKLLSFPTRNGGTRFSTRDEDLRAQVAALALLRRTAEAATVRTAANALVGGTSGTALAVLGDFNDGPTAATTQIFQGPDGSEVETKAFDRADAGDGARLSNLAALIPEGRRYSRIHRGHGELLDQIFVSEEYLPLEGTGKGAKRRRPVTVDALVEVAKSVGDDPGERRAEICPDHAPVVAGFVVG